MDLAKKLEPVILQLLNNQTITSNRHNRKLKISNVRIIKNKSATPDHFIQAKIHERDITDKIKANLTITDSSNKVLSQENNYTIGEIPVKHPKLGYVVGGSGWSVDLSLNLKPGPYVRPRVEDNTFEGMINTAGGAIRIIFDTTMQKFKLRMGNKHFSLYTILKELGKSDSDIKKVWGDKVFEKNNTFKDGELESLFQKLRPFADIPKTNLKTDVLDFLASKKVDVNVCKLNLKKEFDHINPDLLLEVSKKTIDLAEDKVPADDTEHPAYKHLLDEADTLEDRLKEQVPNIFKKVEYALDKKPDVIYVFPKILLNKTLVSFFTQNAVSRFADQYNPLSIARDANKTTIKGVGGIGSLHAISEEMRTVNPGMKGLIDPLSTAEGTSIGISHNLAIGAKKVGRELGTDLFNAKTGKKEFKLASEMAQIVIGGHDYYDWSSAKPKPKTNKILAMHPGGKIEETHPSKIDYIYQSGISMLDPVTAAIPTVGNNSANRVLMGSKHYSQAVALEEGEAPLVQTKVSKTKGYEDYLGEKMNTSPVSGRVTSVSSKKIIIKGDDGKTYTVDLIRNFPLNTTSYFDEHSIVKKGDKVIKGQSITESIFNKQGKSLSLGKNIKVGLVSYYGENFEDSIVLSESGASKFTSLHKHEARIDLSESIMYGIEAVTKYFPKETEFLHLDKFHAEESIPKKGASFKQGDIVLPAVYKSAPSPEMHGDKLIKKLGFKPVNVSVYWENKADGTVVKTVNTSKFVKVSFMQTKEKIQIGDKLCLTEDHEALTDSGWKSIADVTTEDRLATRETDGQITYAHPQALSSYKILKNEKLYSLETDWVSNLSTQEHKFLVSEYNDNDVKLIPGYQLLGKRYYFYHTGSWGGESTSKSLIFKEFKNEFLYILGSIMNCGGLLPGNKIFFQVRCDQFDRDRSISAILKNLSLKFLKTDKYRYEIHSSELYQYLKDNVFTETGVRIPRDVLALSSYRLKFLLNGVFNLWINLSVEDRLPYFTYYRPNSVLFLDDLQELAFKIGLSSKIKQKSKIIFSTSSTSIKNKSAEEKLIPYEGSVYCVTIPNHVFFVRHRGKAYWTGNSTRHGSKGIVVSIVPDDEFLKDEKGDVLDMAFSPTGIPGRVNPGFILEGCLGKISKKTKKKYLLDTFSPDDRTAWVQNEMKQNDVKDVEKVFDPKTGKHINISVINPFFFKLTHLVRKKFAARGAGPGEVYTTEESPKKVSGRGAQSLGALENYATLAAGNTSFLQDVSTITSQRNDDFWLKYQLGLPSPPLKTPYIISKFLTYLKGAGIHLEEKNDYFKAVPLTDKEILRQSNSTKGIQNSRVVNEKFQEETGGLFDPKETGGLGGEYWTHIELSDPIPSPLGEDAIKRILNLTKTQFRDIMEGKLYYDKAAKEMTTDIRPSCVGQGYAFKEMLTNLNVSKELKLTIKDIESNKGATKDKYIKKLKYLKNLQTTKKKPEEVYIWHNVPVIPAKFRPIYTTEDGSVNVSDVINGYREVIQINNQIKDLKKLKFNMSLIPENTKDLYHSVKGLIGLGDPLSPNVMFKGILKIIKGEENKYGLFQGRVVSRRRDLSGRSTIINNPKLGMDDVGIPFKMALRIFNPFLQKYLKEVAGYSPIHSRNLIDEAVGIDESKQDYPDLVKQGLQEVMRKRPVMVSRAPALHKYSNLALMPKLVKGKAIHFNPLVVSGFGADFDGDSVIGKINYLEAVPARDPQLGLDHPIQEFISQEINFDYKVDIDLKSFIDLEDNDLTQSNFFTSSLSLLDNKIGKHLITQSHKKDCKEVAVKTWYKKEYQVSHAHSLIVYDPYKDCIVPDLPLNARFKCMIRTLGYDGSIKSLFNSEDEWSFIKNIFIYAKLDGNRVVLPTDKMVPVQGVEVETVSDVVVFDSKWSQFLKVVFNLANKRILPKPVWSTIKSYRKKLIQSFVPDMIIDRKNKFVTPTLVLSSMETAYEIYKLLKSIGISSIYTRGKDVILRLGQEASLYQDIFKLDPPMKKVGVLPLTYDEWTYINRRLPRELKQPDKGSRTYKFMPIWIIDKYLETSNDIPHQAFKRYLNIDGYLYDAILSSRYTGEMKEMYDLTIPGALTFTLNDGLVVNDTVSVSVPVSEEARKDALKYQKPSNHLFSGRGNYGETLINAPTKEFVYGIYRMTLAETKGKSVKSYKNLNEALNSYHKKEIEINQKIKVKNTMTSVGRLLFQDLFPLKIKIENKPYTKKMLYEVLVEAAKLYPVARVEKLMSDLKDYGAHYSTEATATVSIADIVTPKKERDKIMKDAIRNAKTVGFDKAMGDASKLLQQLVGKLKNNGFVDLSVNSGALGKTNQLTQMIASPVAVTDHRGKVIQQPLMKSYSEGFNPMEYWMTLPGARKGLVDRGLSTADTGAFGKTLLAGVSGITIVGVDCGTTEGEEFPITSSDVLDRYILSSPYKGKIMTTNLQRKLKNQGVKTIRVRSPLKCKYINGICQKCWGLDENGRTLKLGFPIGALAGTTAAEPITQLAMKCTVSTVIFKYKGEVYSRSMDDLWDIVEEPESLYGEVLFKEADDLQIWDVVGWTPVFYVQKHKPQDTMSFIRTISGDALVAQSNHPIFTYSYQDSKEVSVVKPISKLIPDKDQVLVSSELPISEKPVPDISASELISLLLEDKSSEYIAGSSSLKRFNFDFLFVGVDYLKQLLSSLIDKVGTVYSKTQEPAIYRFFNESFVLLQQLGMICKKLGLRYSMNVHDKGFYLDIFLHKQAKKILKSSSTVQGLKIFMTKSEECPSEGILAIDENTILNTIYDNLYVYDLKTGTEGFLAGAIHNHNTFHTGGAVGSKTLGWRGLETLFKLPKTIKDRAILAKETGSVTNINPIVGGWEVYIKEEKHVLPKKLGLGVKLNQKVKAGDMLTQQGVIHPNDLLETTQNAERVENHIIKELDSTYRAGGVSLKRKILELLVSPMTKKVQVEEIDPSVGVNLGILPGDLISRGQEKVLKKYKSKIKFKSSPKLLSIGDISHQSDDFMAELMADRPHKTLAQAPLLEKGFHLYGHPLTRFAFGTIGDKRIKPETTEEEEAKKLLDHLTNIFNTKYPV